MRIKRQADDFKVRELNGLACQSTGLFGLYRLEKAGIGTLEAMAAVRKRWNLKHDAVQCAGLKDRHAHTSQLISILNGPQRNLNQSKIKLNYLGRSDRAVESSDIEANRFEVSLRGIPVALESKVEHVMSIMANDPVPNYFDDQRFGSVLMDPESGKPAWIAKSWMAGDWEQALKMAIAWPTPRDRSEEKREKQVLIDHWRKWDYCSERCKNELRSRPLESLVQGSDFKRAFARIPPEIRRLYISAYQSHLWNEVLATAIRDVCGKEVETLSARPCPLICPLVGNGEELGELPDLPLPTARDKELTEPASGWVHKVLAREGLELRELRVKYPRDSFFSKGYRATGYRATDFGFSLEEDELSSGNHKLCLTFTLPSGCYATILLKRIEAAILGEAESDS